MSQATITTKGQVTIPKAVRDRLDLRAGDRLDFVVNDSGEAVIRRVSRSVGEVRGLLAHRGKVSLTVEQMDEAVRGRLRKERS